MEAFHIIATIPTKSPFHLLHINQASPNQQLVHVMLPTIDHTASQQLEKTLQRNSWGGQKHITSKIIDNIGYMKIEKVWKKAGDVPINMKIDILHQLLDAVMKDGNKCLYGLYFYDEEEGKVLLYQMEESKKEEETDIAKMEYFAKIAFCMLSSNQLLHYVRSIKTNLWDAASHIKNDGPTQIDHTIMMALKSVLNGDISSPQCFHHDLESIWKRFNCLKSKLCNPATLLRPKPKKKPQIPEKKLKQSYSTYSLVNKSSGRKYRKAKSPIRSLLIETKQRIRSSIHSKKTHKPDNLSHIQTSQSFYQPSFLHSNTRQSGYFAQKQGQIYMNDSFGNDNQSSNNFFNTSDLLQCLENRNKKKQEEDQVQNANKQIDRQKVDQVIADHKFTLCSTVLEFEIRKQTRCLNFNSMVYFINQNMKSQPSRPDYQKQEFTFEKVKKNSAKEQKQRIISNKYEDEIDQINLGQRKKEYIPSTSEKGQKLKQANKNEEIEMKSKKSGREKKQSIEENVEFLVKVFTLIKTQLSKEQNKLSFFLYICYLHYVLFRGLFKGIKVNDKPGQRQSMLDSLKNLRNKVDKKKEIVKQASKVLELQVKEYLDGRCQEALSLIQGTSIHVCKEHFLHLKKEIYKNKSSLLQKDLLKPYLKYVLMIVLVIGIIQEPNTSRPELKYFDQKCKTIESKQDMFINVEEECKNYEILLLALDSS